ncbi:MAG: hypothetical protein AAGF12_00115 [Myxococcota bacterium]
MALSAFGGCTSPEPPSPEPVEMVVLPAPAPEPELPDEPDVDPPEPLIEEEEPAAEAAQPVKPRPRRAARMRRDHDFRDVPLYGHPF